MRVTRDLVIPEDELRFTVARSGGPGGQNVNKVSTKAVLRWNLSASAALSDEQKERLRARLPRRYLTAGGEVVVHASAHRDQQRNREACRAKLAEAIRRALRRPKPRKPTKPTRASKERRLRAKQHQKAKKEGRRRITE
ncbi:MAG: aminoacyl-tRNA hydrolase [Planctomycetota bacterium]|nr:MAG: aminoacyl-tRNA hydrolase [Planctomycetota bacterium]